MKTGLSISLRLTVWFSAIFLLGFATFGIAMWLDLFHSLAQGRDRTLGNRARRLLEVLDNAEDNFPERMDDRYRDFVESTPEGALIHVYNAAGMRMYPTVVDATSEFDWPAAPFIRGDYFRNVVFRGRHYRVLVRTARLARKPIRIFVAGQLEDNRLLLRRFTQGLIRTIPILIIAAGMAGYFVSRRALHPIARLIDSGRSITIGNLSRRLPVAPTGDELARLAETWNGMLERLELAVNRITRFTADASHELRSPLSFIRVASESMLRRSDLDAEAQEAFREIVDEAQSATRLLDDLLMLARSDAGHLEVAFQPVDLVDILTAVIARASLLAEAKQQVLETAHRTPNAVVSGDPGLLRRLAWILLDNAVKYTPAGGRIQAQVSRANGLVRLVVSDSGAGIPEAALPHIFERFYRADPARSAEEGTGLGLAIAKWIVDAHGAEVRVTSNLGRGTTFEVLFPTLRAVA